MTYHCHHIYPPPSSHSKVLLPLAAISATAQPDYMDTSQSNTNLIYTIITFPHDIVVLLDTLFQMPHNMDPSLCHNQIQIEYKPLLPNIIRNSHNTIKFQTTLVYLRSHNRTLIQPHKQFISTL